MATRLGLGLVAAATLLAEVVLTRLLSVSHLHVFAFLAVSTALLGTAVGAAEVARRRPRPTRAATGALLFAVTLPLAHTGAQLLAFDPGSLAHGGWPWLRMLLLYVLLTAPFFFAGQVVAEVLTASPGAERGKLYGADLLGAALGSLAGLALIPALGPRALWAASALASASAASLGLRRTGAAVGAAMVAFTMSVPLPLVVAASKTSSAGEPFQTILNDPRRHRRTWWTPHARVDEVRFARGLYRLVLDAGVAAVRIPPTRTGGGLPPSDATLPYELRPGASVLVIGSGAGWEVDEAHHFGAERVVGVEVNSAVLRRTPKRLQSQRGVELKAREARSYLEGTTGRFDVIVLVHTISNAALAGGALALTEDHLFTVEAFERMQSRLTNDGLIFVTRPPNQLPRLLALAAASTSTAGLETRVAAWREPQGDFYGALLLSQRSLSQEETAKIRNRLAQRGLEAIHLPTDDGAPSFAAEILRGGDLAELERRLGVGRLDPPTDDAPFFNRRSRGLSGLGSSSERHLPLRIALETQPLAELALVALLLESIVLAVGFVIVAPGRSNRSSATSAAAIGLAFMMVEISLLQRLGLVLGAPTLGVALGLGGLLVGAGLGSRSFGHRALGEVASVAGGVALFCAWLLPVVLSPILGAPLGVRAVSGALLSAGVGFALGPVLPALLRRGAEGESSTAFAFAVNGAASVAGVGMALILAPEVGFSGVSLLAGILYFAAAALERGNSA